MTAIEWSTAGLALGVEAIDGVHREMIDHINGAAAAQGAAFAAAFIAFAEHTRRHFAQEEALMLACRDANAAEHRHEHARLLAEMEAMLLSLARGRAKLAQAFVAERLPEWLARHASTMDSILAAKLKAAKDGEA